MLAFCHFVTRAAQRAYAASPKTPPPSPRASVFVLRIVHKRSMFTSGSYCGAPRCYGRLHLTCKTRSGRIREDRSADFGTLWPLECGPSETSRALREMCEESYEKTALGITPSETILPPARRGMNGNRIAREHTRHIDRVLGKLREIDGRRSVHLSLQARYRVDDRVSAHEDDSIPDGW